MSMAESSWIDAPPAAPPRVRTLWRDVPADELGMTLAHEHVFTRFGVAGGDPDLEFTVRALIDEDLVHAHTLGVRSIVEASTWDMGADVAEIAASCSRAGIAAIKTTGWFRSPSADDVVAGRDAAALEHQLIADVCTGVGPGMRAGALGETGVSERQPSVTEHRVLDATAAAAIRTGAAVLLHTDDWGNALALLSELDRRAVPRDQIVLCHLRCADPVDEQCALGESGVTLSFDQLGHPARDPVAAVAERVDELARTGIADRIAVSADVGRRSRLAANGGSGYVAPVLDLLSMLDHLSEADRGWIRGGAIARTLAARWEGVE
jgi:phosphotriesterase-related protein